MAIKIESVLASFERVVNEPFAEARAAALEGRKVVGHMCTYTPEELFHAAGHLPIRILAWSEGTTRADGLMQAYSCSLARSALELALSGQLDFLHIMLFSHTCDTLQNLADIWKRSVPASICLTLSTPTCVSGPHAIEYFRGELNHLRTFLEEDSGPVSDEAIWNSIGLYNDHRALMQRLYELRRRNPHCLPGRDLLSVVFSAFLMPREKHIEMLRALLGAIESAPATIEKALPRLFLVGSACQDGGYVAAVERTGCVVVDDDLCTGSRAFAPLPADARDPVEALAQMYVARRPCPAKHRPGYHAGREIAAKAKEAGADGVICLFTKFCDPWAFDYPQIRDTLETAGVPCLLVEIEQNAPPGGPFEARVAAFVETLSSNPRG